jgi:hypothetical protein
MRAIGYYTADGRGGMSGDAFCPDCYQGGEDDSPIFSDTEADSPTHCVVCHELIGHALTTDGEAYVRETLAAGDGTGKVLAQWEAEWPHLAPREPEDDGAWLDAPGALDAE